MKNRPGDESVHALIKAGYMAEYAKRQHDKTKPYPGIMALLKSLNEQGVLVNVLSNKPDPDTQTVIQYYFPKIRFAYVCGKKPGYEVKPDPRSVREMIAQMQLSKDEVLYVGDTYTDMITAKNAGLTSVGVLWGFRKKEELMQGEAHFIIDHPKAILTILKEGIPHAVGR
jgi:phosphoglycolate phosphatase